ncbi:MAG: hypothetical protein WAX77_14820 [Methylococcaceae bacterium]
MKILKSTVLSVTLALSLGYLPTASAVCLGMACMYNKMTPTEGINATLAEITQALTAIHARSNGDSADSNTGSDEVIIGNIKEALKLSKEINANDKVDRHRNRANGDLKKARVSVEAGDLNQATLQLKEAEKRFASLKGMLDLTMDDRESQQTHMLNRILDTPDPKAGARK